MKTAAIIEARMGSSRLPGKTLKPILGKPMLELLIERVKRARSLDGVITATTIHPADDAIEALATRLGVGCFRGSEEDVLGRVLQAAQVNGVDVIVEITGDCPLVDPDVIDEVVGVFHRCDFQYVSNNLVRTFPLGLDVRVFSTEVLAETAGLTSDPADREHVSLYMYEHPERYRLHNVESGRPDRYRDLRLTVDVIEDFRLMEAVYENLYPEKPDFTLGDVLGLFDARPELAELNRHVQQKAVRCRS